MYAIDDLDTVAELTRAPQSSVGAPLPVVLANEGALLLAYLIEDMPADWDGTSVRLVGPDSAEGTLALISFSRPYAHAFGPPNDEAFAGHPLAGRGLHPYGAFEIRASSWVRQLERMNRVHEYHRAEQFDPLRHFIFAFHDSTFECVAEDFTVSLHPGPLTGILPLMLYRIRHPA